MSRRQAGAGLCAYLFSAALVFAAQTSSSSVTGTWTGFLTNAANPADRDAALVILKQNGAELTGSGGPNENQQWAIQKGKVTTTKEGTAVTFEVETDTLFLQFDMKFVDGKLRGTVNAQRGTETRTGTIELERAK